MALKNEELLKLYGDMVLVRAFEEKVDELISFAKITGTTHLGIGQEAIMAGANYALAKDDYLSVTHRDHGFTLLKSGGENINQMMAELHGREAGLCKGRGGSSHMMDMKHRNMGANGIIGACSSLAAGMALALQMQRSSDVILCTLGDGAMNEGATMEAFNLAAVWKLPVVYLCENNQYAMSTSVKEAFAIDDLSIRAAAFGMPGVRIDGNDVEAVYDTGKGALQYARQGNGPTLIAAETYRWKGHSKSDMQKYRSKDEVEAWKKKCPIKHVEEKLMATGTLTEELKQQITVEAYKKVADAVTYAEGCPFPSEDTVMDYVYFEEV